MMNQNNLVANFNFGVSESNRYFRIYNDSIQQITFDQISPIEKKILNPSIRNRFLNTYNKLLFIDINSNVILGSKDTDFTSFYPSSHFDFINGINQFINNEFPLPAKLFINPTNKCNYRCQVCSFNPTRGIKGTNSMPVYIIEEIIDIFKKRSPNASINISGGGEPTLHKDIEYILQLINDSDIKIFMTSNASRSDKNFWKTAVRACSMLVFSVRGLTLDNYKAIDNPANKDTDINKVISNIEMIIDLREKNRRTEDLIIGINSLVHPLNAGHFYNFSKKMVEIGIDFLHFTPVAPNLSKWNIDIDEKQRDLTDRNFNEINEIVSKSKIKIRLPKIPYKDLSGDNYYLDVTSRHGQRNGCYVALFSPALVPSEVDPLKAKLSPCRASEVQDNNLLSYSNDIVKGSYAGIWNYDNYLRVQSMIKGKCSYCYMERQYLDLKFMVDIKSKYGSKGEFVLLFDLMDKTSVQYF
ncbi:MAG: radical SAM protein [Nitrospirae bacterium]|nr:radical SAM protein [Nitrospirota bacterium]